MSEILYAGLYPASYLKRIIRQFREWDFQNWRFNYVDIIRGEKQYHLCGKH